MLCVRSGLKRAKEAPVSAMGERFLILEETAEALDVIDPELAVQFRVVNGLPGQPREEMEAGPTAPELMGSMSLAESHEIRMDVGDHQIRCDCTCGAWHCEVDWDEIDTMVAQIRGHLGSMRATSDDGITAAAPSVSPTICENLVG
jgi:hypothetical protein